MVWLGAYLVMANLVSFTMFGIDKQQARAGRRRISERALLLSAAVSGTFGAWAGMGVFRHKTAKRSFRMRMVAATALDVTVVVLLLVLT
ncbi:MAG TPA: DUF1294 domain-containing protein [Motilibacterales bacterium]|nr:DUF1294 domain-containing protein [Motilibacterales bacterium]